MALLIHFALVIIYANPFNKKKSKIDYLAGAYAYPYFHQNWNLFVPPPACNYTLFASLGNDTPKTDIFREVLLKHQSNRLLGYGPLLIAFSNSIHYFEKNTVLQKSLNGPVKGDMYFDMLEYTTKNYLQHTR